MIRLTAARGREPIDVLVVCTGNICRSPYMAGALATAIPDLVIAGAGTAAMVGWEPVPEVLDALEVIGAPAPARARQLNRKQVRGSTLVLTATTEHRGEVIGLEPDAETRTFTLKEAARLAVGYVPRGETTRQRVADLGRHLHESAANDPWDHDDDLDDPYGRDAAAYATMIAEVDAALTVIAPALTRGA